MTSARRALAWMVCALLCGPARGFAPQESAAFLGEALGAATQAIAERRYEDALTTLDGALEQLPVADVYWIYLMERAVVAELQLRRWTSLEQRLAQIDAASNATWPEDLQAAIADTRVAALLKMGLPDLAEEAALGHLDAARNAYDAGAQNGPTLANAWARVVDIDLGLQRLDRAVDRANAALAHRGLQDVRSDRVRLLRMRGRAEFQQERYDPTRPRVALSTWEEALTLTDGGDELRGLLALDHVIHGEYDAAQSYLAAIRPSGADALVAAVSARWARETGQSSDVVAAHTAHLHSQFEELLSSWKGVTPGKGGVGRLLFVKERMLLAEILLATATSKGAEAALELFARVEASGTAALRVEADGRNTVERVQRALSDRHGALVFTPLVTGGSSVFAVDRHRVVHARLATYHEIESRRREWERRVQPGSPNVLVRDEMTWALELGEHLLPDSIRSAMDDWDAVSICGLELLPMAWLAIRTPQGLKRWGEIWALDRWPSLPIIAEAADRWGADEGLDLQATPKPVAVFASPSGPSRDVLERWPLVGPLPSPRRVLSDLRRSYGRVDEFAGSEATMTAFVEAARDGRGLLQFVGHGVRDARLSASTMLLFAPRNVAEGTLLSSDDLRAFVERRPKTAETVLLLACRSGRATERLGDGGAVGLAGAWLSVGARAVLTAGSDVTFQQAEEISEFINAELAGGASLAEALRDHRVDLIARHGDAAVQRSGLLAAHGLAQRPSVRPLPKATSATRWGVAALVAAIVLLVGFSRRR